MPHRRNSLLILPCLTVIVVALATFAEKSAAVEEQAAPAPAAAPAKRVLVFSGTGWYRHPDIPRTNSWLVRVLTPAGFEVDVTETPADITPERLAQYQVLLLNNANELSTLLNDPQRKAIEDWYKQGGGLVTLHATLVHQTKWQWFYDLAGCDFDSDSTFQEARIVVDPENQEHPAVKGHGPKFSYKADWTNHDKTVTGLPGLKVLLRVDESTYDPVREYFKTRGGKAMGKDHPIAWLRVHGGGRFFYTELGHDLRSLDTDFGRQHVIEGVRWAVEK